MSMGQPPIPPPPVPSYGLPPAPRRGMSTSFKVLLTLGIVFALGVVGVCGGVIYFASISPDTRVLPGRQVPSRFIKQIDKLGLLEDGERIVFFYSDAMVDIEQGLYLVTDRAVVIYSHSYGDPVIRVRFEDIREIDVDYSTTWLEDSIITLTLAGGDAVSFPVSQEGGGDRDVAAALEKHVENRRRK